MVAVCDVLEVLGVPVVALGDGCLGRVPLPDDLLGEYVIGVEWGEAAVRMSVEDLPEVPLDLAGAFILAFGGSLLAQWHVEPAALPTVRLFPQVTFSPDGVTVRGVVQALLDFDLMVGAFHRDLVPQVPRVPEA